MVRHNLDTDLSILMCFERDGLTKLNDDDKFKMWRTHKY